MCVVRKAYQETDSVISSVTTKVKGFALTNASLMELRFWDVADYVIPPQVFKYIFCVHYERSSSLLVTLPLSDLQLVVKTFDCFMFNRVITPSLC